ncbi:hypothetical protein V8E53_009369 [Lactarius tabidus]
MHAMSTAVRAVVALAKPLSDTRVESPEPVKSPLPHFLSLYLLFTLPTISRTDTQIHHIMNYPADLSAFSPWPDALAASEEELAMWAQLSEYAQPEPTVEGIPLNMLDAVLAWGPSRTTPAETFGLENTLSGNWTSGGTVAEGSSDHSVALPDATAMGTTTSSESAMVMPPFFTDNTGAFSQGYVFTQPDFPFSRTPSLSNSSSLPSPQGDGIVDGFLQFPILDAAPSDFVQPPGPSVPQLGAFGALGPNRITGAPPTWFMGGSNFVEQAEPNFGHIPDPYLNMPYSVPPDYTQLTGHLPVPGASTVKATGQTVHFGKRGRKRDDNESAGPQKRSRPSATRVPGRAQPANGTRRPPATRTRATINSKSKAVGRRAERLASTTARGVYHQSLPGLSVPQGSMGALEHEGPSWIVGREQVETRYDMGSSAPQQIVLQENSEDDEDHHKIPGNLWERERLMLQMTQAERERGAVSTIRCKLCPKAQFGTWATFQRHCNTCEKHPLELYFCLGCGDHFARSDSRDRHYEKKDEACRNTSSHDVKQKTEKVERLLEAFRARLTHCLKSGEKIRPMFSDAVSRIVPTNTSKKVSKREETFESLEGTWAAGLC